MTNFSTPPLHAAYRLARRAARTLFSALLPLALTGAVCAAPPASPARPMFKTLAGNIPPAVSGATALGTRYDPQARVDIALTLPFRDKAGLDDYTTHLFDPADPLYHHYLTTQEINDRFGPTQADYDAVVAFAKSQGLTVTHTSPTRMLLDVSAPAATVETAFGIRLMQFQDNNGRIFHAPDREPSVPAAIAPRLLGIIGMDNDAVAVPQLAHGKAPAFKPSLLHGMVPDLQHPIDPGDPGVVVAAAAHHLPPLLPARQLVEPEQFLVHILPAPMDL